MWCSVLGKELQLKWRSIRDAFVRYNRASKKTKSGDPATNTRKYIYARQLEFLLLVPSCNETEDSLAKESLEGNELIQENREEAQDFNDQHSYVSNEPSTSTMYRRKKKNMEEKLGTYMEVMSRQSEATMSQQKDDDYNFLLSILPIMKKLSDVEKLKCRCDIMQLLMRYTTQSQYVVQPTPVNIQFASPQHFEPNMSGLTHEKNLFYNQQHQMIHQPPLSQYQGAVNNRPFEIPPNSQYQTPVSHKTSLLAIATNQPPVQTQTSASYSQSLLQTSTTQLQTTTGNENYEMLKPPSSQVKTTPRYKRQKIVDPTTVTETVTCTEDILQGTCTLDKEQSEITYFSPSSIDSELSNCDSLLSL